MTLACEDANSELVEVVTAAGVDSEDYVGNMFCKGYEVESWSIFLSYVGSRF